MYETVFRKRDLIRDNAFRMSVYRLQYRGYASPVCCQDSEVKIFPDLYGTSLFGSGKEGYLP